MRRLVWIGLILILLIPILLVGLLYLVVDPQKLSPLLTSQISASLGREATIERVDLKLFPPSLAAKGLSISDDPAFSTKPFLTAELLSIRPALLPLFTGNLRIISLELESPTIELIQKADNSWNFDSLSTSSEAGGLALDLLRIRNAHLGLHRLPSQREEYTRLGVELRDYRPGQSFSLLLSATMPSGEAIQAAGQINTSSNRTTLTDFKISLASLQAKLAGEIVDKNLQLQFDIPKSPVAQVAPLFLPPTMNASGEISGKIAISGTTSAPRFNGRLEVLGFDVSGGDIQQPVRTPKLSLVLTPDRISLEPASVTSGSTQLQAYGVIANYQDKPRLEATLLAPNAQLAELLSIARAFGLVSKGGIQARGKADLQLRAYGLLNNRQPLSFAGTGSLREASFNLPQLTKPLEVPATSFRFESNSATLSETTVNLNGTTITGDARISNFARPAINFNLASPRIHLDELRALFIPGDGVAPELSAEGSLKIGSFQMADITLTDLNAQAVYRNGQLALNPLTASLYGGRHSGSLQMDLRPAQPVYTLNSRLEKIESSQLLAAVTSLKGIVSGPLTADLNLRFSPADPVHLARSLNGKVSLNLSPGQLTSFDLTRELAQVARFLGFQASAANTTQLLGLVGDLSLTNGVASTDNLQLTLSNLTASLTGNMNLAD